MVPTLITPPAKEPLELEGDDGAKRHLRVEHALEDALIASQIAAARIWTEAFTRRALITQTWDLYFDAFPVSLDEAIELPFPPLQSVTHVKYRDGSGALVAWDAANYIVTAPAGELAERGSIRLAYGISWPTPQIRPNAVEVRIVCGYGNEAVQVPGAVRCALKLIVGELYKNREQSAPASLDRASLAAENLLWPFRSLRVA